MCCLCCGTRVAFCRVCASVCASCLCLIHFAAIIVTPVYRFRDQGALCALSKTPTYWTSKTDLPKDDFTFAKDGSLIVGLWVVQLLFCMCCCLISTYVPMRAQK